MKEKLSKIFQEASQAIQAAKFFDELDTIRIDYLGRKGKINSILGQLSQLPDDMKPEIGRLANALKNSLTELFGNKKQELQSLEKENQLNKEIIDLTLPGRAIQRGKKHPLTQVLDEIKEIFLGLGYLIAEGPEMELNYYNFEALNFLPDHPARDMQDTFYISPEILLRTHTSPVQIRVMKNQKPPVKIIAPGRVYRRDADITHSFVFHQVEGLVVDKNVTFGDLKGTLIVFLHQMFGPERKVRFRPSYFPFTEPSAEVDVECIVCGGVGCRLCSQTGWLEILGAGMVDPNVFEAVGYDPEQYTGLAFGLGIERIAMLKFGIDDIRLFFKNDLRFLKQF